MAQNWWDKYPKIMPSPAAGPYPVPGPGGVMPGAGMGIPPLPPQAFGAMPPSLGGFDPSSFAEGGFGGDKLLDRAPLKAPFAADQGARQAGPSPAVQWAVEAIRNGADPKAVRARLQQMSSGIAGFDPSDDFTFDDLGPPAQGSMANQFGPALPDLNSVMTQGDASPSDPNTSGFGDQSAILDRNSKAASNQKSLLVAAPFQPDDRPEDPLTHMMATDERAAFQPDDAQAPSRRFDPYSEANLSLGPNEQYRADILGAARFYHLTPYTVAASIGAEVGGGRWNPGIENRATNAVGLMQFLPGTWIGEANRRGSFLNGVASRLGYLDRQGHLIPGRARQFLAIRNNPSASIWAGADYAAHNLAILQSQGFIRDQSPAALARYAYLAHHEGLGGARSFLRGAGNNYERAFRQNVSPAARARYLAANNNDTARAYRSFLSDYVDGRVDVTRYMTDRRGVVVPPTRSLLQ